MILASPAPAATPAAEKAAGAALTRDSSTTVPKAPVAGSSDAQNAPIPAAATPWEVKSVQEWGGLSDTSSNSTSAGSSVAGSVGSVGNSPRPHPPVDEEDLACASDLEMAAAVVLSPPTPGQPSLAPSAAPPGPVSAPAACTVKREASEEMETEDAEAASILSKVLPDMHKLTTTFADARGSIPKKASVQGHGGGSDRAASIGTSREAIGDAGRGSSPGSRRGGAKGYEDLLDCLASLASNRPPVVPAHCRASRMSVDDMDLEQHCRRPNKGSRGPSPFSPSLLAAARGMEDSDEEEEEDGEEAGRYYYATGGAGLGGGGLDGMEVGRGRRPRAASNPEGCDTWRRYGTSGVPVAMDRKGLAKGQPTHASGAAVHDKAGPAAGGSMITFHGGLASTADSLASEGHAAASTLQAGARAAAAASAAASAAAAEAGAGSGAGSILPHMLAKYSDVYNKHGRIGIYTRDERDAIIARFREKRQRRVWKKKIRYSCRKNLADKRVRVKGRFVKLPPKEAGEEEGGGACPGR
ncbi:hypothetical protein NGA_0445710, partial [Nannochloropsis gaditana CCMP526]|uniref:uncharacterized protein n=1 Tax=Nannochloropsis gaditana (strain CCMP526) TaxID=1093141 RepID=UPI00029F60C0